MKIRNSTTTPLNTHLVALGEEKWDHGRSEVTGATRDENGLDIGIITGNGHFHAWFDTENFENLNFEQ